MTDGIWLPRTRGDRPKSEARQVIQRFTLGCPVLAGIDPLTV